MNTIVVLCALSYSSSSSSSSSGISVGSSSNVGSCNGSNVGSGGNIRSGSSVVQTVNIRWPTNKKHNKHNKQYSLPRRATVRDPPAAAPTNSEDGDDNMLARVCVCVKKATMMVTVTGAGVTVV